MQRADANLKLVINWVEGRYKPKWQEISKENEEVKYHWSRFDSLVMKNSVLRRRWKTKSQPDEFHFIIPKVLCTLVLKQLHDSPTGGHLGLD